MSGLEIFLASWLALTHFAIWFYWRTVAYLWQEYRYLLVLQPRVHTLHQISRDQFEAKYTATVLVMDAFMRTDTAHEPGIWPEQLRPRWRIVSHPFWREVLYEERTGA